MMSRFSDPVRYYLLAYLVFLVVSLIPQLFTSQAELFMMVNRHNTPFLDKFFYFATYLGDGVFFIVIMLILALFSYRKAVLGVIIFLVTSLFTQLLKRAFFVDQLRPYARLRGEYELHIPAGVEPLSMNSFPSGHTTTAFSLAIFLVLVSSGKLHWAIMLGLAIIAGYSRIYLTHHFPIDVWVGSIIGTFGTVLLYYWLNDKLAERITDKGLLNR